MEAANVPVTGALVGWTAERHGNRVVLKVQTVNTPPPHHSHDVQETFLMLDENQAVQLGNMLFQITGNTSPASTKRRRAPLITRLMGA
jgi:hypothetical protein